MSGLEGRTKKFYSRDTNSVTINALQGHFATSNSHINYYVDVNRLKIRTSEAANAARALCEKIVGRIHVIDTIVCLDETRMLGGFLAENLQRRGVENHNMHKTVYVVKPEENSLHQFMFRSGNTMAIGGKNCLILTGTLTTGNTVKNVIDCVEYYGGKNVGVAAIFSTMTEVFGYKVFPIFDEKDLPGYAAYKKLDCPYCQKQIPIEAIVNGSGYAIVMD